jgi:hypothetical protein
MAWLGAYADSFWLSSDDVSSRALGYGEFAFPIVLMARSAMAGAGSVVFLATLVTLFRGRVTEVNRSHWKSSLVLGGLYAVILYALIKLATWREGDAGFVILLWTSTGVMPMLGAWLLARRLKESNGGAPAHH